MKILVVDDEKEHLEIMHDIFESEGYSVSVCMDGFHALEALTKHKFDCVLLDLRMPIFEGHHLLPVIHEKYPSLPIIIISGHIEDEDELLAKGAYAVLLKSPHISSLISTVETAIHESKNAITFSFNHINLNQIKNSVVSRLVTLALKKCHGNQLRAAASLGISRQSFIRYMKKYRISVS